MGALCLGCASSDIFMKQSQSLPPALCSCVGKRDHWTPIKKTGKAIQTTSGCLVQSDASLNGLLLTKHLMPGAVEDSRETGHWVPAHKEFTFLLEIVRKQHKIKHKQVCGSDGRAASTPGGSSPQFYREHTSWFQLPSFSTQRAKPQCTESSQDPHIRTLASGGYPASGVTKSITAVIHFVFYSDKTKTDLGRGGRCEINSHIKLTLKTRKYHLLA